MEDMIEIEYPMNEKNVTIRKSIKKLEKNIREEKKYLRKINYKIYWSQR